MRALIIDDLAKARVQKVRAHAEQKANWYIPDSSMVPGNDPKFVAHLDTYRCVFTITMAPKHPLLRHLSISIPKKGSYPNPIAVWTIADLFGFTGYEGKGEPAKGWAMAIVKEENCVVVQQEYVERKDEGQ
jgi:hypothetical protein